jgi:hypothetical protein
MRAREKQFVAEWNSDRRSSFPLHRSNFGDSNRVVVGRLDPTSPSADLPGNNARTRRFDRSQECRRTPIPPLLCRFGLIPGLRQFDIDQVNDPLTGKTIPRLANKPFGQAYFYMSLFGSSSAGNEPSWAQYGPELSNQ